MRKKLIIILIGVALLSVLIFQIMKSKESIYVGSVEVTKIDVASRLPSLVSALNKQEGELVTKDEVIAQLSCEDLAIKKKTAEEDFLRSKKLFLSGTLPQEKYDHVKAQFDEIALNSSWCQIKSPVSGILLQIYKDAGEWVAPGTKVFTVANLAQVWVYVYVPQEFVGKLKIGEAIEGYLPEQNRTFKGIISKINDEAEFTPKNVQTREERTRLVYGVKVSFENTELILKPGMMIEVRFAHDKGEI